MLWYRLGRGFVCTPFPDRSLNAGSQRLPPVPFFPEVHEELTRSWKAPFTARNKSCGSSPLTTLDGGAALGYTGIPSVERSVAMQLCPTVASTLRGEPCLPSRACKYSSGLTGSAYRACGEVASALHTMALLQVHQAKAWTWTRVVTTWWFYMSCVL